MELATGLLGSVLLLTVVQNGAATRFVLPFALTVELISGVVSVAVKVLELELD